MPCCNDEFYKKVCADTKITVCLVVITVVILALIGFAIYLVVKPVECKPRQNLLLNSANRMNKHADRKPTKCKESSILNYPQLAAVVEKDTDIHVCSGALLPENWLLTAAHCLTSCNGTLCTNFKIRAGSSYSNRGGYVFEIQKYHIHPHFNSTTMLNNIGLINIKNFQVDNETINYATISSLPLQTTKWAELLGWAPFSKVDIIYRDNILKTINLTIEGEFICKYRMKGEYMQFTLERSMLCGTYPTMGGGCYTDAGGPLMRDDAILGIAIFGQFCYSCDYHMSILTDVYYVRSFIKKYTEVQDSPTIIN